PKYVKFLQSRAKDVKAPGKSWRFWRGRSPALRLAAPELAPARIGSVDVSLVPPDRRRGGGAAPLWVPVGIAIDGGVDQHAIPLSGAEQVGIAVAPARRRIKAGAEGRRHDHDVVLAGIDPVRDGPVDRGIIVDVDVVVDDGDMLVAHMRGRRAPQR